jgi:hypothetical protein
VNYETALVVCADDEVLARTWRRVPLMQVHNGFIIIMASPCRTLVLFLAGVRVINSTIFLTEAIASFPPKLNADSLFSFPADERLPRAVGQSKRRTFNCCTRTARENVSHVPNLMGTN